MKITHLFNRPVPAAIGPLAPRFQSQLAEAQARLDAVRAKRAQLAFAVATGADNADAEMQAFHAETAALQREVDDLAAALSVAQQKDREAEQARRLAAQASRVNAMRQHLATREKAALKLQAAIANAVVEYEAVLDVNRKIFALLDDAKSLPEDTLAPPAAWRQAVAAELYKAGCGPRYSDTFPLRFPGGAPPHFDFQAAPDRIATLSERVRAGSAMLLGMLGAAPAPTSPPPPAAVAPVPVANDTASGGQSEPDPAVAASKAGHEGAADDNLAHADAA
jgi:hypothetical protein